MRPRAQLARVVVVVATPTRLNAFMLAVLPLSVLGMQCGALLAVPLQAPRRRPLKKAFVDLGRCTLKFASQVVQTITLLWESKGAHDIILGRLLAGRKLSWGQGAASGQRPS